MERTPKGGAGALAHIEPWKNRQQAGSYRASVRALLPDPRERLAFEGAAVHQPFAAVVGIGGIGLVVVGDVVTGPMGRHRPPPLLEVVARGVVVGAEVEDQAVAEVELREHDLVVAGLAVPRGGDGAIRQVRITDLGAERHRVVIGLPTVRAAHQVQRRGPRHRVDRSPHVARLDALERPVRLVVVPGRLATGAGVLLEDRVEVEDHALRAHDAPRVVGRGRVEREAPELLEPLPQQGVDEEEPGLVGLREGERVLARVGLGEASSIPSSSRSTHSRENAPRESPRAGH